MRKVMRLEVTFFDLSVADFVILVEKREKHGVTCRLLFYLTRLEELLENSHITLLLSYGALLNDQIALKQILPASADFLHA